MRQQQTHCSPTHGKQGSLWGVVRGLWQCHISKWQCAFIAYTLASSLAGRLVAETTLPAQRRPASAASAIERFESDKLQRFALENANGAQTALAQGVLLAWSGDTGNAAAKLGEAWDHRAALFTEEAEDGLLYLALVESLEQHYARAAQHAKLLLRRRHVLSGNDLSDFREQAALWSLLAAAPPMAVLASASSDLRITNTLTQRLQASINVDGEPLETLFDTGAEMTVVGRGAAHKLNVRLLPGKLFDPGSAGKTTRVSVGIVPRLQIGSVSIVNLPVMVEDDAALVVGPTKQRERIDVIVGESLLRRLGTFSVIKPGFLTLGAETTNMSHTAALLEDGPALIFSGVQDGTQCRLLLDTGATTTILTRSFYRSHRALLVRAAHNKQIVAGIGGSATIRQLILPDLTINTQLGSYTLHNISVFPNTSALDVRGLDGNLGRDLWVAGGLFQIDYRRHMLHF